MIPVPANPELTLTPPFVSPVTGMKEDLGLYGNQLTLMGTLFGAGNIVFQIPSSV